MEHNGKYIIVADMGELKCYQVKWIEETDRYHFELQYDLDYIEGRQSPGETLSDDRGRFRHESGDDHGVEHESQQRLIHHIANDISVFLADIPEKSCYLAFPAKHHNELISALSKTAQDALAKNIVADLVKCPIEDLLSHF